MNHKHIILILFLPVLLAGHAFGSGDSLSMTLSGLKDSALVDEINELAWDMRHSSPDSALIFIAKGIREARRISYNKGLASAYNNQGSLQYLKGNYDLAIPAFENAVRFFKAIHDSSRMARAYNNIGLSRNRLGQYNEAISAFETSIEIKDQLKNRSGVASSYKNLGNVYQNQGDYKKAVDAFINALRQYEYLNDTLGMASVYNNIGNVYYSGENLGKAREYYEKALKLNQRLGNDRGIANCYTNIGNLDRQREDYPSAIENYRNSLSVYRKLNDLKGEAAARNNLGVTYYYCEDFNKAVALFKQVLDIYEQSGDKRGIAMSSINLGSIYAERGQAGKAIFLCRKALTIARQIGSRDLVLEALDNLSAAFASGGDYSAAIDSYNKFLALSDSVYNEQTDKQIAELASKYENERQQNRLDILKRQRQLNELKERRNDIFLYSGIVGILLLIVIGAIVLKSYIRRRKNNRLLSEKNAEIEEQKAVIEKKNNDILDSINYARGLQRALLPDKSAMDELNRWLKRAAAEAEEDKLFVVYKPKDIVAGDFYWIKFIKTKDRELYYITVADCTGHGVPGAFMSMIGMQSLDQIFPGTTVLDTGAVLDALQAQVTGFFKEHGEQEVKDGMDISLCALSLPSLEGARGGLLQWAGANNPLWLIRQGELLEWKGDKQPIGKYAEAKPFTTHNIDLKKGDSIYLFTDGFADQFGGPKGKKFKYKPFKQLLLSIQDKTMEEQRRIIDQNFEEWKGSLEQIDDVCVIGVRL